MTRRKQRGLGTLAMCLVLLGVLALGAAWAARQLVTAQRVAAGDLRAATAAEATESGMAWVLAMLNGGAVDDRCRAATVRPAADSAATAGVTLSDFRGRFLLIGADGYYRAPATSPPSGMPACTNAGPLRWTCRCGASAGAVTASPGTDGETQAQFSIRFADAGPPGQLTVTVRGCSDARADCDDLSPGPVGVAEAAQHLALLSALRVPPPAALVEGPGSFLRVFGYPPERYRDQPALTRLRCAADCSAVLAQALARGRRLLWIDGDAQLTQWPAAALDGTPLVLVVDGRLELTAPGAPQGVLYAKAGIGWHPPAGSTASWRGALISDGHVDKAPGVELVHDAAVLYRVHRQMGSYLPVPGGWTPTR